MQKELVATKLKILELKFILSGFLDVLKNDNRSNIEQITNLMMGRRDGAISFYGQKQ